jgi:transposase
LPDTKNQYRSDIMKKLRKKEISLKAAAQMLDLSCRHTRRIYKRFVEQGKSGLIHRLKGRASNRSIDEKKRKEILDCYKTYFPGLGSGIAGKGLECLGYSVNRETLRLWLLQEKIKTYPNRKSRSKKSKKRKIYFGEKVHLVSCLYRRFNGQNKGLPVIKAVDEASGITLCLVAEEREENLMRVLWKWIERYGIPKSICCEYKYIYKKVDEYTRPGQSEINKQRTAFGQACKKLNIAINSIDLPALTKHVLWCHRLYKDVLERELKRKSGHSLEEISNMIQKYIKRTQNVPLPKHTRRSENGNINLKDHNLNTVFCFEFKKPVSEEGLVRHEDRTFYITEQNAVSSGEPYKKLLLTKWLDGSIHIYYKRKELAIKEIFV